MTMIVETLMVVETFLTIASLTVPGKFNILKIYNTDNIDLRSGMYIPTASYPKDVINKKVILLNLISEMNLAVGKPAYQSGEWGGSTPNKYVQLIRVV